jgi:hypothetical protein
MSARVAILQKAWDRALEALSERGHPNTSGRHPPRQRARPPSPFPSWVPIVSERSRGGCLNPWTRLVVGIGLLVVWARYEREHPDPPPAKALGLR